MAQFFSELLRRKVVRLLCAYIALFWLLAQGFASLFPAMGWPIWLLRAFVVAGLGAIPILAIFSWKYNIAPPRLVRDPGDVDVEDRGLAWAMARHDAADAGQLLLKWHREGYPVEKRSFTPIGIGRDPKNGVELPDRRVSRYHAVLWAERGVWHLRDLNSTNGTFLDRVRVNGIVRLPESCELRFHQEGPTVSVAVDRPTETLVN